ncbi:hypothetical protein AB0I00_29735 [Streptomyces sp. NPDC050803]|uniref:hypothetical protein n=1 Tax=unclassified Streptomyces TaxID=2593676 RepID=UPI003444E141
MGSLKVTLCAGAALVAALLPPAAHAADGGGISVSPASPAPGSDIALRVTGCTERTATAVSAAFVADVTLTLTGAEGALVGESRVRSSLKAGGYEVKVTCGSAAHKATLTVADRPSAPASPVAPVSAGGGGTAARLAATDARTTGPGTAHAVTGLVLAGVAATAVALRSARRSRGTD